MAKFYGQIGYAKTEEKANDPGIYVEEIIERTYSGDLVRNTSRYVSSDKINDDISINNNISIIADQYSYENFQHIRYIIFMGAKWKVINVEIARPRIVLTIGGKYNE